MPGLVRLVPGIHVFLCCGSTDVDGIGPRACPRSALLSAASRVNPTCGDEPGHDGEKVDHYDGWYYPKSLQPSGQARGRAFSGSCIQRATLSSSRGGRYLSV